MDVASLKQLQLSLQHEIISLATNLGCKDYITNGVADIDGFVDARPRIMWLLKEAYGEGGWDHCAMHCELTGRDIQSMPTEKRVAYTSYGLMHNERWAEMPYVYENDEMVRCFKSVAWINVSKLAGDTVSDNGQLKNDFHHWEDIVRKQIEVYDPQIIILGNTYDIVKDMLAIGDKDMVSSNYFANLYQKDGRKIVWAYHPNARIKDEDYVNGIIDILT